MKAKTQKTEKTNLVVSKVNLLTQVKKETTKKPKVKKVSFHDSLLNVNRLDKQENFSLSGAVRRFEKQLKNDTKYITIDVNVVSKGLEYDTILKYINQKCIDNKKFTVYSVGLAFNKFLKVTL